MSVLSSIFKKRSTSSTKFLLSFYCRISLFRSCMSFVSTGVSRSSSSQIQFLLLRIPTWPFCNHTSRMRNATRRICVLVTSLVTVRFPRLSPRANRNRGGYINAYSTLRCGLSYILSLAPKRLLFVSYKSKKRAAKYSQFSSMPELAIRELQPLTQYCAHAHSVPRV